MAGGLDFALEATDPNSGARAGRLTTPHGVIETPVFMPVGTQATVKTLDPSELEALGAQIILGNAYHLYLRPGISVLEKAGGLHQFMHWNRPILTDSGGFQVFSLAKLAKVTPEGVRFQSHIDGSQHFFSPESAIDVQIAIGADIMMCFDECTSFPVEKTEAAASMRMTAEWAARCKQRWEERSPAKQTLFGIVQGGVFEDLRVESVERTVEIGCPGFAIGGVRVGESREQMLAAVEQCAP